MSENESLLNSMLGRFQKILKKSHISNIFEAHQLWLYNIIRIQTLEPAWLCTWDFEKMQAECLTWAFGISCEDELLQNWLPKV